jgi:acyl-coenzyme A thioesterase PaaI-like protein
MPARTWLELKVACHRALSIRVRAEGLVLSFGRRVAFAEGKLMDGEGRLCASATFTLLIMER